MTLKDLESRLASGEPFAVTLWNEVQAVCVPDRQLAAQMAVLVVSSRPLKLPPFVAAFASGVNNREYWYRFAIADADMRPLAPPAPPAPVARPIAAPTLAQRAASASAASASAPPAARRRR